MRNPPRDGAETVSVFPRCFRALLQLLNAQLGWLKDYMLAVVKFPILCEKASFGFEAFVECGVWEWRHNGEPRQIDVCLHSEFGGLQENVGFVMIEAENKAALQGDSVFVEAFDHPAELLW